MNTNTPKIKLTLKGTRLDTLRAISSEFQDCGKLESIILSTHTENKKLKINDKDFNCLYENIVRAKDNHLRYPNHTGKEYENIIKIQVYLENSYYYQRGNILNKKDLKYPSKKSVQEILTKLGIDPKLRDMHCQDIEYTSCKMEELEEYIDLYIQRDTSIYEKRVLGCYFLECLNEYIAINKQEHPRQNEALKLLFSDIPIHKTELDYWSDTSKRENKEDWWYITKPILNWKINKI